MRGDSFIQSPQMEDELLIQKEYITKYKSDLIKIMIGKTKDNIFIRSTYYELKLNIDYLSSLTKTIYKSIDEAFEFIEKIFNENKYKIKEKSSKSIKLIITIFEINASYSIIKTENDIELILLGNFENQNILIKELFDKYINIEKEIYEIKNDNKLLKEENDKLKQNNNNIKMEIEMIINNNKNEILGIQMQNMNMIQEQINNLIVIISGIEQRINMISNNNLNFVGQNNFNNFNPMNNIFNFNHYNLNEMSQYNFNSMNNNLNMNGDKLSDNNRLKFASFIFPGGCSVCVLFKDDDLISTIIERFRLKTDYFNKYIRFIFNEKIINPNYTAKEIGLSENSKIYISEINLKIFKIYGIKDINFTFIIKMNPKKVSELIDSFLSKSGLSSSEVLKYVFNSKVLNENMTIEEAGLKNNSEIIVYLKNPFSFIYINFHSINNVNMNNNDIKIECLKTETIETLIDRYRYKTDNIGKGEFNFSFDSKKIEKIEGNKNIEEFGLKDNSIITVDLKPSLK